jgi:hypothetical protein
MKTIPAFSTIVAAVLIMASTIVPSIALCTSKAAAGPDIETRDYLVISSE